jgi:hypothetical protein
MKTEGAAGRLATPSGPLRLPAFLPDATRGVVRCVEAADLRAAGVERTVEWARRCREAFDRLTADRPRRPLLFCVLEGGGVIPSPVFFFLDCMGCAGKLRVEGPGSLCVLSADLADPVHVGDRVLRHEVRQ